MVQNGVHYIQNQWLIGSGASFSSLNPATGSPIWSGSMAGIDDVLYAIESSRQAFLSWVGLDRQERLSCLKRFAKALSQSESSLAVLISQEVGKPLWESRAEVASGIRKVDLSIQAYQERCSDKETLLGADHVRTRYRPLGVMVVLGPYNFPLHVSLGHILPALLAGNTVVFKPSELVPLSMQLLLMCFQQAGFPKGVINMVQGDGVVGSILALHPDIDGVLFTGSYEVGRQLSKWMACFPEKCLALELGGNNPLIVSQIKDVDAAVLTTIQSAFVTSGQRCSCARRLIIVESALSGAFLDRLIEVTPNIVMGAYDSSPEPFMGPLAHPNGVGQLMDAQHILENLGGEPLLHMTKGTGLGAFVTPGIIDMTRVSMRPDEEWFGPLLQVIRVPDLALAIEVANDTKFGLSLGILSQKRAEFDEVFQYSRAGVINWNAPTTGASSEHAFGGVGCSGNFRPSGYLAVDYCSYPVVSKQVTELKVPKQLPPGLIMP